MTLLTRKAALALHGFTKLTARAAWGTRRIDGVIYFFVWEVDLIAVGNTSELTCNLINAQDRAENRWGFRERLEHIADYQNGENAYALVMKQKEPGQSYHRTPLGFYPDRRYKLIGLNIDGENIDARLLPVGDGHDDTIRRVI